MWRRKKQPVRPSSLYEGLDVGKHVYTVMCNGLSADDTIRDAERVAKPNLEAKGYRLSDLKRMVYFDTLGRTVWAWYEKLPIQ